MVVVHRVEVTVDAEKGVGDGGPVTGQLSVVLVVEHPRRDARAHDQPGSSLEEEVAPGDPGRARGTAVAQDCRREAVEPAHGVDHDPATPGRLLGGVDPLLPR